MDKNKTCQIINRMMDIFVKKFDVHNDVTAGNIEKLRALYLLGCKSFEIRKLKKQS